MIKYALKCSQGHEFESWFASGSAYDDLRARNLTACVQCGDTQITKALMAPQLRKAPKSENAVATPHVAGPAMQISPMEQAIAKMRAYVESNSDYVGADFAKTARDMHNGTADARAIFGEAKPDEARALIEDGIPILPLPFGPKSKAN